MAWLLVRTCLPNFYFATIDCGVLGITILTRLQVLEIGWTVLALQPRLQVGTLVNRMILEARSHVYKLLTETAGTIYLAAIPTRLSACANVRFPRLKFFQTASIPHHLFRSTHSRYPIWINQLPQCAQC